MEVRFHGSTCTYDDGGQTAQCLVLARSPRLSDLRVVLVVRRHHAMHAMLRSSQGLCHRSGHGLGTHHHGHGRRDHRLANSNGAHGRHTALQGRRPSRANQFDLAAKDLLPALSDADADAGGDAARNAEENHHDADDGDEPAAIFLRPADASVGHAHAARALAAVALVTAVLRFQPSGEAEIDTGHYC